MKLEHDEIVLDYWKLPNGNYIVKMKKNNGLDVDCDNKIVLPSQLGSFILSSSKRIMNSFIRERDGFHYENRYYSDTHSLYIEKKCWEVLDKAKLVGEELC